MKKVKALKFWFLMAALTGLAGVSAVNLYLVYQRAKAREHRGISLSADLRLFNTARLPLYQRKAQLCKYWIERARLSPSSLTSFNAGVQKEETLKNLFQVEAILNLVPKWEARTALDIEQMDEIMTHLDTHWSNFLVAMPEGLLREANQSLELIERQIRESEVERPRRVSRLATGI
jgi:hypothetical protein